MNDWLTSLIRTWVPIGVGAALSWLAGLGVDVAPTDATALATGATAVAAATYYALARALEARWPAAGYLLGARKPPTYNPPES